MAALCLIQQPVLCVIGSAVIGAAIKAAIDPKKNHRLHESIFSQFVFQVHLFPLAVIVYSKTLQPSHTITKWSPNLCLPENTY